MSAPQEWLTAGEIVTLGRWRHEYLVVTAIPTAIKRNAHGHPVFSEQEARRNPMIYRFRNLETGSEFCLSHCALTGEELQSRRRPAA